jgi:hypothetical protein
MSLDPLNSAQPRAAPLAVELADEANHRIANHLAVLAALMRLQAKGVGRTQMAPSFSALKADVAVQLAPVRGIKRSQLRADWHCYAVSWIIAACHATSLEIVLCDTLNRRAKSACVAVPSAMALTASAFWCAVSIGGRPMWTPRALAR